MTTQSKIIYPPLLPVRLFQALATLTVLALAITLSGCGDPCVDLSREICKCEPSEIQQRACIQRVDNDAATRETTERQQNRCEQLLDTCTCNKLADGDLAACGLANKSEDVD